MYKFILLVVAVVGIAASVMGLAAASEKGGVFDDAKMESTCVFGSLIGSLLAVAAFPPINDTEENRTRRLALKLGVSLMSGIAFAPGVMQWLGYPHTTDSLLAGSAATAVVSVSVLHLWNQMWKR